MVAWIAHQRPEDCFLSVVSVGEIERGIARRRATDLRFAQQLADWLNQLLRLYGDRLLPLDVGVARRWGLLSAEIGHDSLDLLIASTATTLRLRGWRRQIHGLPRVELARLEPSLGVPLNRG